MKGSCDTCGHNGHMVENPHEYMEAMCKHCWDQLSREGNMTSSDGLKSVVSIKR